MNYIIYTEIIYREPRETERWFYGMDTRERANEVAISLGTHHYEDCSVYHCVCPLEQANDFEIRNLPL